MEDDCPVAKEKYTTVLKLNFPRKSRQVNTVTLVNLSELFLKARSISKSVSWHKVFRQKLIVIYPINKFFPVFYRSFH